VSEDRLFLLYNLYIIGIAEARDVQVCMIQRAKRPNESVQTRSNRV